MLVYEYLRSAAGPGDSILDIGTKTGEHLRGTSGRLVASDIAFQRTNEPVEYVQCDGRQLPFDSNTFDFVVCNQVIEHVEDDDALLGEMSRVLTREGTALVAFPNRFTLNKPHGLPRFASILPKRVGIHVFKRTLDSERLEYYKNHLHPVSPREARKILEKCFETVEYATISISSDHPEIYSGGPASSAFRNALTAISAATRFGPIERAFESVWGHVAYKCTNPRREEP
ncbi:class I SAM-dependent methyltransferase [Halobaculum sp. EA56]|uniref:class I SAM-dependent methyltransferase n=1 Tax=Halobaculum sp. EA56 TaxID=3421648 RepID=UPI003EB6FA82